MARKVTITKEMILEAALTMLIRDGYAAVNIKTVAKELGCSTQPIAWQFENMEVFRRELRVYAQEYARKTAKGGRRASSAAFEEMGRAYVRMAIKEPNLFRYLYLGESPIDKPYTMKGMSGGKAGKAMVSGIAAETGLSEEQAGRCIRNTVIYSHGLATMVATGVFRASEKDLMAMIRSVSEGFVQNEMRATFSGEEAGR